MPRRRRLIEIAFPLDEISAHSRREKTIRHGHISNFHIWWARRPLAACGAFMYASLVDDPEADAERNGLLKEVADLASWDAVRTPSEIVRRVEDGGSDLTGHELLERARRRILASHGGKPPMLLDPFAGGGAIPLEALRLGCEVEASDLNPVAVLILKGTVEYPQKYGRPLAEQRTRFARGERDGIAGVQGEVPEYVRQAVGTSHSTPPSRRRGGRGRGSSPPEPPATSRMSALAEEDAKTAYEANPLVADVRYWGTWMLERAREELAELYPPDPDGSVPVAYLWSRIVPCPSCKAEMPLIRQYWLVRKDRRKVALQPVVNGADRRVEVEVVEGPNVTGDPAEATTSRGDTLCLLCRQVVKVEYVRHIAQSGSLGAVLTAVVVEQPGRAGKRYRAGNARDLLALRSARDRLSQLASMDTGDLPVVPDEPIDGAMLGLRIGSLGFTTWGSLFSPRQCLVLTTFSALVRCAHDSMVSLGLSAEYARAVSTIGFLHQDLLSLPLTPKRRQAIMASESSSDADARRQYVALMESAFASINLM